MHHPAARLRRFCRIKPPHRAERYQPLSEYPNASAFLALLVGYVLVPIVNAFWPLRAKRIPDDVAAFTRWQTYYRILPVFAVPAQIVMLYIATDYWSSGVLGGWGRLGYLLSTGFIGAFFAINVAHELIHRKQRLDRLFGGILLSTVGFGVFKIVHLRIHHRHVGTPLDFATAPRGQSLYRFWWQSLIGTLAPAITAMKACGGGQVVAISSLAGVQPLPRLSTYCASKAAPATKVPRQENVRHRFPAQTTAACHRSCFNLVGVKHALAAKQ